MKLSLNLGCGDRYVDGWVNVDFESPHRVDQRVDLTEPLPWESGSVSRIYAGHLFEHLLPEDCERLAADLLRCADPVGCSMVVVGPDVDVATGMVADGTFDHSWGTLDMIRHGAGRWAGDVHLWETTGPAVAQLIRQAGWSVVHQLPLDQLYGWPIADATQKWQYAVHAWAGQVVRGDERDVTSAVFR